MGDLLTLKFCFFKAASKVAGLLGAAAVLCALPSQALCPGISLPPQAQLTARSGLPQTQFALELSDLPDDFSITNGVYGGWALASLAVVPLNTLQPVQFYHSYAPPAHLALFNLDLINYVLNHKQGQAADVQAAIGVLAEGVNPWDLEMLGLDDAALAMVEEAFALGPGFVPAQSGQVVGVIVDLGASASPLVLEVAVPPNAPPQPGPDTATTISRIALVLPVSQLLTNDIDPDGDTLSITGVDATSAQGGTVSWLGETIVYAPPVIPVGGYYWCFVGTDTFGYTVQDAQCGSARGIVTVEVRPPNRPPTAGQTNVVTWVNWPVRLAVSDLLALANDPDGDPLRITAVTVDNEHPTATGWLQDGLVASLPPPDFRGVYQLRFTVVDNRGGTAVGTVQVSVVDGPCVLTTQVPTLNPRSGLFEQVVVVSNAASAELPAFAVAITGLGLGVRMVNATGLEAGIPFVQCNHALAPGQSLTLRLEYYAPEGLPVVPHLAAAPANPQRPQSPPSGQPVRIDRCFQDRTWPGQVRTGIEFGAVPGRTYTVLYSDDLRSWKVAAPSFQAWAERIWWYDDGPPKTDPAPTGNGLRFYRLIEAQ